MSRMCELCGKKPVVGHKISHSNIKTKIRWFPSLSFKKIFINGILKKIRICSNCLKTYTKNGAVVK